MRKINVVLLAALSLQFTANSQYWQQQVNYTISVSLNDKEKTLDAFEKMEYVNNSPDTLRFIWIHLWPNAYKSDRTAFSDQLLENGNTKFYFSNKEEKGYINRLDFKVDNITAQTQDHPEYIDVIKLILPSPLPPGKKAIITTPFHVKLPYNFSRGGYDGESFQITQWYPKPAVYDNSGWHPMPYLDQGEFYSEFGSFDVTITVPQNYVVAATGELQNNDEKEWLKTRSNYDWKPVVHKEKIKGVGIKNKIQLYPETSKEIKVLRYHQENVHDFAWFADKRFIVKQDTLQLKSGKIISVFSYFTPANKSKWETAINNAKRGILHYSSLVGEYPYSIVSVVQGPSSFGGGMEYPTITVISPLANSMELDYTIAHEIGHNWFYGILGSNERDHAWMDEGINTYYESLYAKKVNHHYNQFKQQELLDTRIAEKKDQPIETPSAKFSETNYNLIAYYKASQWIKWLEQYLGTETFNKAMQEYYKQWQFKHPQPADLKKILESVSERNLDAAFSFLNKKGNLPGNEKKGAVIANPAIAMLGGYSNKKTVITILPVVGYNSYDQLMAGAVVSNLRSSANRFQFLVTPLYGTGSKKIDGIGFANYYFYPKKTFRKIAIGISGSKFSAYKYTDNAGNKTHLGFTKIAPGIRFIFKEKDPRSTMFRFLQFKTFLIREQALRFYRDTIITGIDTTISTKYRTIQEDRTLNQLSLSVENNRALYPYNYNLKIEQGKEFVRAAFTGNYFFNYPKHGGLNVRLFAGKFFYTHSKTISAKFATDRYHLNMTGPNGYEDYTYSDYFIGRNDFGKFKSQQIMLRDGAFKIRTDLLAEKIGKTDSWLAAINLTSSIPKNINPLSLLPVNIPLKVFVDIGTTTDAWKTGVESDRFIYDAGIYFPLLKETINIYIPLIYSNVFKYYIESTIEKKKRLWKNISFTIDISNFSFRKIDRNLNF